MDIARLRNIGVVAHIDAGKTTVSERILYLAGVEHRIGEVDDGTAVMDWMPQERERGISITAAATTLPWRDCTINLIDTPGHVDFTVEVERSLRVLDGAVLVIDAVAGVQAQSETVWRQMRRHRVPSLAFVNKCDRSGADFLAAVGSLQARLGAPALALQYPLERDGRFVGVIDLVALRALEFAEDASMPPTHVDVPTAVADDVRVLRGDLLERASEEDDTVLAALLEDREPDLDRVRAAIRRGTIERRIVPVLCGAAFRNIGVQTLLDAVVEYLPSPLDRGEVLGKHPQTGLEETRAVDPKARTAALAFKLHSAAHGDLTFVRVYSGVLLPGDQLLNPRTGKLERIARLLRMHADAKRPIETAGPGEIVAVQGLKHTATGDTLCDPGAPIVLESLLVPEPVISMVVEPASTADRDKLRQALEHFVREDPTFHAREDETTGQWIVAGMGELHLEVLFNRLRDEFHVEARSGKPRVSYREAVRVGAVGRGRVERALGGKDVFGAVELELLHADVDRATVDVEFADDCKVPAGLRATVRDALIVGSHVGPRFGFPLTLAKLRVFGGESKPRVDAEAAYAQAAAMALREALSAAQVDLLEPLMSFEIHSPPEFASGILADLASRRAEVESVVESGGVRVLVGKVPLANMFGYSTVVRSLSQGRAGHSLQPAGFTLVPIDELAKRGLVWT